MDKGKSNVIVKNSLYYIIGALIGAAGGYCYWHYIGCSTGVCPITSTWIGTSVSGGILGSLISGLFIKENDS